MAVTDHVLRKLESQVDNSRLSQITVEKADVAALIAELKSRRIKERANAQSRHSRVEHLVD